MKDFVIYHGSPNIVEVPVFGKGSLFSFRFVDTKYTTTNSKVQRYFS